MEKNPESIKKHIEGMVAKINEKHPNAFSEERVQEIVKMFTEQANSDSLNEDINKYLEQELTAMGLNKAEEEVKEAEKLSDDLANRTEKTFAEIKFSYEHFKRLLKQHGVKTYLYGALSAYLIAGQEPQRDFDSIDMVCELDDIQKIRRALIDAGLYDKNGDSISKSDAGDYGFEFVFEGVPINIKPFEYENGVVTQYSYDSKSQKGTTIKQPVYDLDDYILSYRGHDGEIYDVVSMEYLKKKGDVSSNKLEKETADSINPDSLRPDVYDRLNVVTEGESVSLSAGDILFDPVTSEERDLIDRYNKMTPEEQREFDDKNVNFSPMTEEEKRTYENIKMRNMERMQQKNLERPHVRERKKETQSSGYIDTSLILILVMLLAVGVVALCYLLLR